jgi:cobalt/nickel transport system permease protein
LHIAEGFLPHPWWEIWFAVSLPIVAYGVWQLKKIVREAPATKPMLALAGAFAFVLSSLKIPSVTGSCSHATGTGLGAILFGPAITSVLSVIVLLYQALLLAHGGLTTLGANTFSMGIMGPFVAWLVYRACTRARINFYVMIFLASALGDWATYITTALQLALSFPAPDGGVIASFKAFLAIFAITQVPLAAIEGVITVFLFKYLLALRHDILVKLRVTGMPKAVDGGIR